MLEAALASFASLEAAHTSAANGHRFRRLLRDVTHAGRPGTNGPGPTSARYGHLAGELERSLHRRDFLVNKLFRSKNCQRLLRTEGGRRALVSELRGLANEFCSWGDALAPAVVAYAVAEGRSSPALLMQRVDALANVSDALGADLAAQTQAALDMDPQQVEDMIQVLRELERRRAKNP
jgi:hypothetical protein